MDSKDFEKLLGLVSSERLRPSTRGKKDALIESESDKGRVINHAAFRRLLGKAQVFPLDTNAAVRTRLTHSIEVSQLGRYLAQKIIEDPSASTNSYIELAAFVNVVETACLLHDIGNPPFGHFGEAAIQKWFTDHDDGIRDLENFDGNPQGFRLITYLAGADEFGLNLTCTLILATIKYPWTLDGKPGKEEKIGLFEADVPYYEQACTKLHWPAGKKFPFLRLMEAADNIAYAMSDLEDGLEKGVISLTDLKDQFGASYFPDEGTIDPFVRFKTGVITRAVEAGAQVFTENLPGILAGEDVELVDKTSDIGDLLAQVKRFARARIYSSESAERIELSGRSVIVGLLRHFGELLDLEERQLIALINGDRKTVKDDGLHYQERLLRRLPASYLKKYSAGERGDEDERRAHLVVDFISGMTDDFALETYQVLDGIRIR